MWGPFHYLIFLFLKFWWRLGETLQPSITMPKHLYSGFLRAGLFEPVGWGWALRRVSPDAEPPLSKG